MTKDELRERLRWNLEEFAMVVCGHLLKDKTPKFHTEMYRALEKNAYGIEDYSKLCFIIFRGGAKSTLAITINYLWRIAYDLESYCWIIAESQGQAMERMHDIKAELETNRIFRDLYGNFTTDKWSEQIIVTENPKTRHRCKIVSRGIKQRMRGGLFEGSRLTLVSPDDFESEDNTETAEIREKLVKRLFGILKPATDPKRSKFILTGTVVHHEAYLNRILQDHIAGNDAGYRVTTYEVDTSPNKDGSQPIWPERFSTEWINKERIDYARDGMESLFWQEYYNEAVAPGDRAFPEELVKYWDGFYNKEEGSLIIKGDSVPVYITIGIDIAMGKKKGDFSAMVAVGTDHNNFRYTDRVYAERIQPRELIDKMFEWDAYYTSPFGKPLFIIETNAAQELLSMWLREIELVKDVYLRKKLINQRISKTGENSRFLSAQPLFEAGRTLFKREHHSLLGQITRWGINVNLKNDDLIDAWQMAISESIPCGRVLTSIEEYQKRKKRVYDWAVL